jgi:hypothetical protein
MALGTRYASDQNKVVHLFESGTYAGSIAALGPASSTWIGQIQEFTINEEENISETRYMGTANRNVSVFDNGVRDVSSSLSYRPQDLNLFAHAIGSTFEASASNTKTLVSTESNSNVTQNPFISGTGKNLNLPYSFTLEDSKQAPGTGLNYIRTVRGNVINTATLTATQGEPVVIEMDLIGQHLNESSGATTTLTQNSNTRSYHWNDGLLTLAGSTIDAAKEVSIEINQNVTGPHYINGSRTISQPFYGNRDYTINVTADLDTSLAIPFYQSYFKAGSTFNGVMDLNNVASTGSQHAIITFSGCRVISMEDPSTIDGLNERTIEIKPQSISLVEYSDIRYVGSANPY